MSERVDSDSDAPEEFTSEQGFKVDELIRKVQKENKDRVVHEGKERRKQWAERKTPRPSKENENVKEVLEVSEAEKETPGADVMHAESTPSTDGMLPENIVQMLAAREKKVFASDSEDEKTEEKPRLRKKKLKTTGIEIVVLNGPKSEKLAQNSLEFLKKKRMEVPRLTSILKHKNQTRLETRLFVPNAKNRTFKFENSWIREEGCLEVIQNSWASSAGKDIQDQLKICGLELDSWGRNLSNQIRERINAQKKVLGKARGRRDRGSLSELIAAEKELNRLLKCEEDFWRQRAKIFWLQSGDLNTRAFQRFANGRKRKQLLTTLQRDDGVWVDKFSGLNALVFDYFESLFTSHGVESERVISCVKPKVTTEQNEFLTSRFTADEIREAVFSMKNDKAPGEDGFNPAFYKKYWSVVGGAVTASSLNWLETGIFPTGLNNTNIVLIPKKNKPSNMKELRPIALCNVIYKIMAKVLANRLRFILPNIVDESQSGFVKGRLITDNIVIANEVVNWLKGKRKGRIGWAAMKIDIAKAYDKLEWDYLEQMLLALGFCSHWVGMIMACVRSVRHNVLVGDDIVGPIIPRRGLRQGDPLSPYLFILAAEGLISLIKHRERAGLYHGCKVALSAPSITHLFFADDAFLFFRASREESAEVKELLHVYGKASGQEVNYAKSSIIFSANVPIELREVVSRTFNVVEQDGICKYLGMPLLVGRKKKKAFEFIKGKLQDRLLAWKGRNLSRAGKEILLKSVAQALPSYCMSLYLLSDSLCDELHRMMNNYWWGGGASRGGIKWFRWEKLCFSRDEGGIGFRDLKDFNQALLAKQGWRLVNNPDCLMAKVIKARYYRGCNFLESCIGDSPSAIWRSVWLGSEVIRKGCRLRIGSGDSIRVCNDPWLPCEDNGFVTSVLDQEATHLRVSDLFYPGVRRWDDSKLQMLFNERDFELIMSIPLGYHGREDSWYWMGDKTGVYSVKAGYRWIRNQMGSRTAAGNVFWKQFWSIRAMPKMLNLLWRAANNCLPTRLALSQRHVIDSYLCPVCQKSEESVFHALVTCDFAKDVWNGSGIGWWHGGFNDFREWLQLMFDKLSRERWGEIAAICWGLWHNRNQLVWNGKSDSARNVSFRCLRILNSWKNSAQSLSDGASVLCSEFQDKWRRPMEGWLSCCVDAAVFNNGGATSMVRRDHRGSFMGASVQHFVKCRDPAFLEVLAIRESLSWIKSQRISHVLVQSDCLVAVTHINSSEFLASNYGLLIMDCRDILSTLENVRVVYCRRSANLSAHSLVKAVGSISNCQEWNYHVPQCIADIFVSELME